MAEKTELCAHKGCNCAAPAGGDYCSDNCSLDESDLETGCRCGHPECQMVGPIRQTEIREALEHNG
jgi:hypothetical protein